MRGFAAHLAFPVIDNPNSPGAQNSWPEAISKGLLRLHDEEQTQRNLIKRSLSARSTLITGWETRTLMPTYAPLARRTGTAVHMHIHGKTAFEVAAGITPGAWQAPTSKTLARKLGLLSPRGLAGGAHGTRSTDQDLQLAPRLMGTCRSFIAPNPT